MKTLILLSALIAAPALADQTVTLANGQRCTRLDDGRIVGCTAPTKAQDAPYAYPYQHRRYHEQRRQRADKPVSAGWKPEY